MGRPPAWSDHELAEALRGAQTISEASQRIGRQQSGATTAMILRHATRLGLDDLPVVKAARAREGKGRGYARTWTDDELADVVADSRTWTAVAYRLGVRRAEWPRQRAYQLGLDTDHLEPDPRQARCTFTDCDRPTAGGVHCLVHQRQLAGRGFLAPIRPWRQRSTLHLEVELAVMLLRHHHPELLAEALRPPAPLRPALVLLPRAG